jgi:beta-galactosidase
MRVPFAIIILKLEEYPNAIPVGGTRHPHFWRAFTHNDYGNQMPLRLGIWRGAHISKKVVSVRVGEKTEDGLKIEMQYKLNDVGTAYQVNYTILNNGSIKVEVMLDATEQQLPEMPRFGMRMQVSKEFENIN